MWIAKFKFWHPNSSSIDMTKKSNCTIAVFPLNNYIEDNVATMTAGHILMGDDLAKKKFIALAKKQKQIMNFEVRGNYAVYSIKANLKESHLQMYFTPEIFLAKPILVKPDGWQYIELASWEKKHLKEILETIAKFGKPKNISIRKEPLEDVYVPHLFPKLTPKQKNAVGLAYQNGFYKYPKQSTIEALAKKAGSASSTFQEHLRKAEEKLISFLMENISEK